MINSNDFCAALIGLTESDAKQLCLTYSKRSRVVMRNGNYSCIQVLPFDENRINLVVVSGKVSQACKG